MANTSNGKESEKNEPSASVACKDMHEQMRETGRQPVLSADFYGKLLRQPACIVKGICDGCGRCEH